MKDRNDGTCYISVAKLKGFDKAKLDAAVADGKIVFKDDRYVLGFTFTELADKDLADDKAIGKAVGHIVARLRKFGLDDESLADTLTTKLKLADNELAKEPYRLRTGRLNVELFDSAMSWAVEQLESGNGKIWADYKIRKGENAPAAKRWLINAYAEANGLDLTPDDDEDDADKEAAE